MQKRSYSYRAVVSLLCLSVVTLAWGCSGKRVASSSGDAASTTKEKSATASAPAPVETISPERMVTIPDDRRSTMETAREPLAALSSPSESPIERPSESPSGGPEGSALSPSSSSPAPAAVESSSLGDIFFDFDQYVLRGDALPVIEANAAWLKGMPGKSVIIEGHCDERGTQAYNLVLGEKRARSAKRYLENLGVPGSRMKITSYGEIRPFCKERDEH